MTQSFWVHISIVWLTYKISKFQNYHRYLMTPPELIMSCHKFWCFVPMCLILHFDLYMYDALVYQNFASSFHSFVTYLPLYVFFSHSTLFSKWMSEVKWNDQNFKMSKFGKYHYHPLFNISPPCAYSHILPLFWHLCQKGFRGWYHVWPKMSY